MDDTNVMTDALTDPNTVHVNMLAGRIAKPSPAQIWHIYGAELLAAMPTTDAAGIVERLALAVGLGQLELTDDGLSLMTPHDGDVDSDGRHIIVGGDILATFEDSDAGEILRDGVLALPEAAATIAAQAAELQRLREGMTRAEAAFTLIAGSHWERFGIDQTDVEQVPDLSSDEAMNVARDFLAYDDFPATSQVRHD